MSGNLIIIISVVITWAVISYLYWRVQWKRTESEYIGFDLIFLTAGMGIVITRVASVIVYRGLFGGGIKLSDFVNLANPDFQYVLFPLISVLAFQFFSFNVKFDRKWMEKLWEPIWFGAAITAVIMFGELIRVISAGWGISFVLYHLIQLASLAIMVYIGFWGKRRRKFISPFVLAIVVYTVGVAVSYTATQVFALEETRLRLVILVVTAAAVLLPYLSRTVWEYSRSSQQPVDSINV